MIDLDEDRLSALSGPELREFREILLELFPSHDVLDMFLADWLDTTVASYGGPGTHIELVLFQLVRVAKTDGWLVRLVTVCLREKPASVKLREFARRYEKVAAAYPAAEPGPFGAPLGQPPAAPWIDLHLNSAFFDLTAIQADILTAVSERPPVLAFATSCTEDMYLDKLQERIESAVGREVARKSPISLSENIGALARWRAVLKVYRDELDLGDVSVRVHVDRGVSYSPSGIPDVLAELWDMVRRDFPGGTDRSLVLLFVVKTDMGLPAGIVPLPAPAFQRSDINVWAFNAGLSLIKQYGWPAGGWRALSRFVCSRALPSDDDHTYFDTRSVYEALDRTVRELQRDPAAFRNRLGVAE